MSTAGEPSKRPAAGTETRLSLCQCRPAEPVFASPREPPARRLHQRVEFVAGEALGITDTQVRKDLAPLGSLGQPGIGYEVAELIGAIRSALGIDRKWSAALVGVGNLARALLRYHGFAERGFEVVALFDRDAGKVGERIEGLLIQSPERMAEVIAATGAELGIITVPADSAQAVADELIEAGVKGLLNFAPGVIRVPPGVAVVPVDLTVQLEQLAFLVHLGAS